MEESVGRMGVQFVYDVNVNELKFSRDDGKLVIDFGNGKLRIDGLTESELVKMNNSVKRVMQWGNRATDLLRIAVTGARNAEDLYTLNGYLYMSEKCPPEIFSVLKGAYASLVKQEKPICFALWNCNRPSMSLEKAVQRMCDARPADWYYYGNGRLRYPYAKYSLELFMFVMAERSTDAFEALIEIRSKLNSDDRFRKMLEGLEALNIRGNQITALICSEIYDVMDLPMAVEVDADNVVKITNDMIQVICNTRRCFDNKAVTGFNKSIGASTYYLKPNMAFEEKEAVKNCTAF